MIKDFYCGKAILISGTTGFIGKVLLEKFMSSLPDVRRIYLLVRPKRGVAIMDRVRKEIFLSQCFDNIRDRPYFEQMISEKIVPIEGDICKPNLDMKPEDRERLINDLDVIINVAASINFVEKINDAIQINYYGSLRMMELATQCKHLDILTHVSTCYVNANIPGGFIKEEIYDWKEDPEDLINRIQQMSAIQQEENLPQILGSFPNTYTFTKSMAERVLKKRRPANLPMLIVRPSIVGSSYRDPFPGWTDTMSAIGAVGFAFGIGIVDTFAVSIESVVDMIPADFVTHNIIVGTALSAKKPELTIVHASSSHSNPILFRSFMEYGIDYFKVQPFDQQVATPGITYYTNKKLHDKVFYLTKELPVAIFDKISRIPGISTPALRKKARMQSFVISKIKELFTLFTPFSMYEWVFENTNTYAFINQLTDDEKKEFSMDPKDIVWANQIRYYGYGLQKYLLKQDPVLLNNEKQLLITKNKSEYFEDFRYAFFGRPIQVTDFDKIRHDALNSTYIQRFIQKEASKTNKKDDTSSEKQKHTKMTKKAAVYLDYIEARRRKTTVRASLYFFLKVWHKAYDQIIVNEAQLFQIRTLINEKKDNIILVPTHKSLMDFIILGFIHYHYEISHPFVCGDEALFNLALTSYLIKSASGFKLDSEMMKDDLFKTVASSYVFSLLKHNQLIELFLEKRRSRTGKIQQPTEQLFNQIVKLFISGEFQDHSKKDIKFIPITLNYDRILEGDAFPLELLGEEPQKETLFKLFKKLTYITRQFGRVNIKYGQPISLQQYVNDFSHSANVPMKELSQNEVMMDKLAKDFGMEISYSQLDNVVVMSTSLIATVLLMHRKGISTELLLKRFTWIFDELKARKGELNLGSTPSTPLINQCLNYLSDFIENKRDIFEPSVSAKTGQSNILMLSYYRNNLIHFFVDEAEVACTLLGINSAAEMNKGALLDQVYEKFRFLRTMLNEEFLLRDKVKTKEDFAGLIQFMASRKFLSYDSQTQNIQLDLKDDGQKLAQSFLHHLLLPYIECYWITLVYFMDQENITQIHGEETLYGKIQWLIETLYTEGLVRFYEAQMLEPIKNAITSFVNMGILTKHTIQKKKNEKSVNFKLAEPYLEESKRIELYESIIFYLPYSTAMDFDNLHSEMRKLTLTDIPVLSKL